MLLVLTRNTIELIILFGNVIYRWLDALANCISWNTYFFVFNAYFQVNLSERESERENRGVANVPITGWKTLYCVS